MYRFLINMDTIVKRIRAIARDLNIGEGNFETTVGVSTGYFNITQKRNGDPGVSIIKNIIDHYPQYSIEWIVTGYGDMKLPLLNVVNKEAAVYSRQSKSVQGALIDLVKLIIKEEVQPQLLELNDSVLRLMKQDLSAVSAKLKRANKKAD